MAKKKVKGKTEVKLSVNSYKQGIKSEKQKMSAYSTKFGATVKSLQNDFKGHAKALNEAALKMRKDGAEHMGNRINEFKGEMKVASKLMDSKVHKLNNDIKSQVKENKEAVSRIENGVKFFLSEVNKKQKDFQAYADGPFNNAIKAFWG